MTFTEIFTAYYRQYRAEATVPTSTDDEYTIALSLANEAVNRWSNYENTFWRELFTTNLTDGSGDSTVVTGQTDYDAGDNFREAGGFVRIRNSTGTTMRSYPILEPDQVQFRTDMSSYAYFTGDPSNGYMLHLNPAPDSAVNGMDIDYPYYKTPTLFTTGTDVTEMSQPYFIVHRMLANRFRASRNPYYQDALRDAEDALRTMQIENNSGNWANPWKLADNSGAQFGSSFDRGSFF